MYLFFLDKFFNIQLNSVKKFTAFLKLLILLSTPVYTFAQKDAKNEPGNSTDNISSICSFSIADSIAGNKEACTFVGIAGGVATYSITAVAASYYVWTVSNTSNMQIIGGQGTPNITVQFAASYGIGSLSVKVGNTCGPEITRTAFIFNGPPPIPGEITGDATACPYINYDTNAVYTISKVVNATSYNWTVPQGITILSRPGGIGTPNDTTIIVKFDNTFVAGTFITVNAVSQCGISSPKNFTIHRSWSPVPEIIIGPMNSCAIKVGPNNPTGTPVVYKTNKVRYAVSYIWTVPPGATIISPVNGTSVNIRDTCITVLFSSSYTGGYISVQSKTGCGISPLRSIPVNDHVLATPAAIYGTLNPCPTIGGPDTTAYRIKKVDEATTYFWSVPAGATIVGHPGGAGTINDTIILVRWTSGFNTGTIDVNAVNNCMNSTTRSLTLVKKMPLASNGILVAWMKPCPNRHFAYMINTLPVNANSVVWTVPPGATILSGQGTLTIKVEYASTAITGNVTVTGVNSCGLGTPRMLAVSLPACSSGRELFSETQIPDTKLSAEILEATIFPNPGISFTLSAKTKSTEKIHITITNIQGTVQRQQFISANEKIFFGNELLSGVYFIHIRQGSSNLTKKFVKL